MVRLLRTLSILTTIYATKCFINLNRKFTNDFHFYDEQHLQALLRILSGTYSDARQELKFIFRNETLTKEELNATIIKWAKKQSKILEDAIVNDLSKFQEQIMQMQKSVAESLNINAKKRIALQTMLQIKTNMSLTKPQENNAIKQLMKLFNRTERTELNQLLSKNFQKQKLTRYPLKNHDEPLRSKNDNESLISDNDDSDDYQNNCDPIFSCKFRCLDHNSISVHVNLNFAMKDNVMEMMKNSTNEDSDDYDEQNRMLWCI